MKTRKIKKEGAPGGRSTFAFRGGVPPLQATPIQSRRPTAKEYTELLTSSPTKRHRDGPLPSATPLKEEDVDGEEDEDPAELAYETEKSAA